MNFNKRSASRAAEDEGNFPVAILPQSSATDNVRQQVTWGSGNEISMSNGVPDATPSSTFGADAGREGGESHRVSSSPSVPAQRRLAADALPLFVDLHRSLADDVASTSDRYQRLYLKGRPLCS